VGTPLQLPMSAQITELGVPPLHPGTGHPFPGTGYRPGPDPNVPLGQDALRRTLDIMAPDWGTHRPARPLPWMWWEAK
jgi:hypothetical protein